MGHFIGMILPSDLSVFQLLDRRLDMLAQRQSLVAENVANANTPKYTPRDVDMSAFETSLARHTNPKVGSVSLATTDRGHLEGRTSTPSAVKSELSPDSEITMDGNGVVVEEQMLRLNQVRTDFDTAMSLYQKGLALIRLAARSPN